jgi:hypothetical protein
MAISAGSTIGKEISGALGLKNVIDLDISLHLKEVASITVKYLPDKDDLSKLTPILKKYRLVDIKQSKK